MYLTIDLGSTVTKVDLFDHDHHLGGTAVEVAVHIEGDRIEHDPEEIVRSVTTACQELGHQHRAAMDAVSAMGFSGARQSLVAVDRRGQPVGPVISWSDRRAGQEAAELAADMAQAERLHSLTGIVVDGRSVAAKLRWLDRYEPNTIRQAEWLLSPRDFVHLRLTGRAMTDTTMASASGLYGPDLEPLSALMATPERLAEVVEPETVTGSLLSRAAEELGLPGDVVVVIGAGDRACEVLGVGASPARPMVSFGTTANVSLPVEERPELVPAALTCSRSADRRWLLEGGLSGAGSVLDWLGQLTGLSITELVARATPTEAGANGITALPWFDGARAPWWDEHARGAFFGITRSTTVGELARATLEGIARDLEVCRQAMATVSPRPLDELVVTGAGATTPLWCEIVAATFALRAQRCTQAHGAASGVARLIARALGESDPDPLLETVAEPDPISVALYQAYAQAAAPLAARMLDSDL